MENLSQNPITSGILGLIVGDALGLPVQFENREARDAKPVTDMFGYGVFNLPSGSWSDDSSLTLCLVSALNQVKPQQRKRFLDQLADCFCQWYNNGDLTPFGYAYDIGGTTSRSISQLAKNVSPLESGGKSEYDNGNGSLMRILPLAYLYQQFSFEDLLTLTHQVGSVTHGHIRSNIACGIYIIMAVQLLERKSLFQAYNDCINMIRPFYEKSIDQEELKHFDRIFSGNIHQRLRHEIQSSGYVVHSLEAAVWCLLTTDSYQDAVLTAVNLGEDTDTVAAITGGLAGIFYGLNNIPQHWLTQLQKLDDIVELVNLFVKNFADF